MATFTDVRTAKKQHHCDVCRKPIEPGQKYERFTATPHDEIWNSEGWKRLKAHTPYGHCLQPEELRR
jgi:predicted nucleic acid-binding Zn ribbon protein